ncbi:MAG: DUF2878 domain-containing protein [Woeseiaceae bacterium]|nr:DUF2878 domain-containing protein [Woeseiaceae bacterium]
MKGVVINLSLFKFGWLAVVFSAAAGLAEVGAATVALIALVHLVRAHRISNELALLLVAGLIGLAWETLLVQAGFLSYPTSAADAAVAPYWIVAMWVLFATTLNVGMKWLRKNLAITALAGAICGPLSFVAGQKAGAVDLADNSILVIGLGWAILLPAVTLIARALDGYSDVRLAAARAGDSA